MIFVVNADGKCICSVGNLFDSGLEKLNNPALNQYVSFFHLLVEVLCITSFGSFYTHIFVVDGYRSGYALYTDRSPGGVILSSFAFRIDIAKSKNGIRIV